MSEDKFLNPADFIRNDREFIRLVVPCRRKIDLRAGSQEAYALKTALLDFEHALSGVVFEGYSDGKHHYVFYGDPRSLTGSARLSRIEQSARRDRVAAHTSAIDMRQTARIVHNADIQFTTKCLSDEQLCTLVERMTKIPREHKVSVKQKGLWRTYMEAHLYGPIVPVLNADRLLRGVKMKKYSIRFD